MWNVSGSFLSQYSLATWKAVVGIVECASAGCAQKLVLTVEHGHGDPNRLAAAIDHFMCTHECGRAACQA